ncbi:cyclin-dependent kinase 11.1-like [Oratosquilla oratoria]|uniref:cyclin-dependent kinase 11.1-like n=1 Tax=Oratosquilla oratoria TaxID=337810 RepID=UPI003F771E8C
MIRGWLNAFGSVEGLFGGDEEGGGGVGVVTEGFSSDLLKKDFEIGRLLGSGSYGWVHRAVTRSSGEPVAIKCQLEDEDAEAEITALKTIDRHANVIGLQEVIRDQESEHIYIVLDIMDVNLEDTVYRMAAKGLSFSESELKSVWQQCLNGLRHVHRVGLLHRDLAARNILLDRTGAVKLTDFGMSILRKKSKVMRRKDLFDLSVVFIFSVSQQEVDDLDLIDGKVNSAGVRVVESLYFGGVSLGKILKSRYFFQKPLPQRPRISHILSDTSTDDHEEHKDASSHY